MTMLPRDALSFTTISTTMAPSTREVLHDLTTARGLVDWRLHRVGDRDVVVGRALSDRLQDNRLQRKRKHQSGTASGDVDAPSSLARSICSFVVVSTAREPTLSMESLLDLHATASGVSMDDANGSLPIERLYLCLTDAGNISYYQVAADFAPFSSPPHELH